MMTLSPGLELLACATAGTGVWLLLPLSLVIVVWAWLMQVLKEAK